MRRRLDHAPGSARWANATPFAGKRHQKIMTAGIATGAGEAVRKDATFEVFTKRSLDIRRWGMHVALTIKLTARGERKPGFEVIRNGAIKQALLWMTGLILCAMGLMRNRVLRMERRSR
jgi:hypothetical protein